LTPTAFAKKFRATAQQVSAGTRIDPIALLAQWASETAWGQVVVGNNLGNIRCSPTSFCSYPTLSDFAKDCIATFHNGFYEAVLAAKTADDQLAAIVASAWSAGHYGGSLTAFYQPLEGLEMTPDQDARLLAILQILNGVPPNIPPAHPSPFGTLVTTVAALKTELDQVKASLAGLGGGALTAAQAQQLADIHATLIRIENAFKAA
jgi:hypothetical protein